MLTYCWSHFEDNSLILLIRLMHIKKYFFLGFTMRLTLAHPWPAKYLRLYFKCYFYTIFNYKCHPFFFTSSQVFWSFFLSLLVLLWFENIHSVLSNSRSKTVFNENPSNRIPSHIWVYFSPEYYKWTEIIQNQNRRVIVSFLGFLLWL